MTNRLRILMVDDSEPDLLLMEEVLAGHISRVELITQSSGAAALLYLQDERHAVPDVIITDLNMPGISGFDLIRMLKDDHRLKLLPVVVLSTSSHPEDIRQAYSLHASSYLVKAPDFQAFVAQIEQFLSFWQGVKGPYHA